MNLLFPILAGKYFFFNQPRIHTSGDQVQIYLSHRGPVDRGMEKKNFEGARSSSHFAIHNRDK